MSQKKKIEILKKGLKKILLLLIEMVNKSAKQMQSNGSRLNVEDSKYMIFKSKDQSKKLRKLESMAHDLIDFVNSVKIMKKNNIIFIHVC